MSFMGSSAGSEAVAAELRRRSKAGLDFATGAMLMEDYQSRLVRDAIRYYTSCWQTFTHPGIFCLACEAVGGDASSVSSVQGVMAMLAAAFDLHDDVIDESVLKQTRKTVLGRFGKEVALLVGDAFLIKAFTVLGESSEIDQRHKSDVWKILQESLFKLGNAHAMELSFKGRTDISFDEFSRMLELKATSAEADMRIGAIAGKGSNVEVEACGTYGKNLGVLTTLREEFIDVIEFREFCQRAEHEYLPMPVIFTLQDSKTRRPVQRLLASGRKSERELDAIVKLALRNEQTVKLLKYADKVKMQAIKSVKKLRGSPAKLFLKSLVETLRKDLPASRS